MIKLTNVKKIYNHDITIALNDLIMADEKSYCILGPSGSGKSTLLNMIAGIVKPTTGVVNINDTIISNYSQKQLDSFRYSHIGYISQDFKLFEEFSVLDNLSIVGVEGELKNDPKAVLSWVGLHHKSKYKVKTLSGGEKQRVAIARALLKDPKVMLCDEPTGSLNFDKGSEIISLLIRLHKEYKSTLIVVTHDDRLTKYFDEIIRFEDLLVKIKGSIKNV